MAQRISDRVNRSRQGKDIVQVGDVVTVKEDGKKRMVNGSGRGDS